MNPQNSVQPKCFLRFSVFFVMALVCLLFGQTNVSAQSQRYAYGVVKGNVVDQNGKALSGAVVTLVKEGTSEIAKEVRSAADGSFIAKVSPGRYIIRAIANGFSSFAFSNVHVNRSAELVYRFNLVPDSSGNTAAAKRNDRDSQKWKLRGVQKKRSIFQAEEDPNKQIAVSVGETTEITETKEAENQTASNFPNDPKQPKPRIRGVVETYTSFSANSKSYIGANFALARNLNDKVELIVAGQTGIGESAIQRFETIARWRLNEKHKLNLSAGAMVLGNTTEADAEENNSRLGQISLRAVDEWLVREGVVVVLGVDYSRFVGPSSSSSVSPRFGLQIDVNARTRVKFAFAPGGEENNIQSAAEFEDTQVIFKESGGEPVAVMDDKAVIEKSNRLEFGIERILSESSSIEAIAFFDTTSGRGVGLLSQPLNALDSTNGETLLDIANQQGAARGIRIVYSRRISEHLSASAGYSFGRGQEVSPEGITTPDALFREAFFQTAAAQLSASFNSGTQVRTVFRFSPKATVFAIDPFAGRLAVYDPSLSILVTQELPTFGLPLRAVAVIDARNIFDVQTSVEDGEARIFLNNSRRLLRGGISVRF